MASRAWPERPTRWSAVAIERGEPSRQVRSTVPTSMPSSSDAVATTSESSPALSRCSASKRRWRLRLLWCAATRSRAQALGQVAGHALDQPPRVDEHQRGAVLARQRGHPIVDLLPLLVGAHRAELVAEHLDGQVHVAPLAHVDDLGQRPRPRRPAAAPRSRWAARWPRGRCAAGARRRADHQLLEPLERERQVRAALVAGHRVDLVHDHGAHVARASARLDSAVSRMKSDSGVVTSTCGGRRAACRRSCAGVSPVRTAVRMLGRGQARRRRRGGQLAERLLQVAAHVVGQRLERRDVEDRGAVLQPALHRLAEEPVEAGQEGGERLAGAGGRGHQHVLAGRDQRPGAGPARASARGSGRGTTLDDGVEHRTQYSQIVSGLHAGRERAVLCYPP